MPGSQMGEPAFEILSSALPVSVQGAPFRGHRHIGVPLGGAADPISRALANWLVGAPAEAPALEITLGEAKFRALQPLRIGLAGAAPHILVDGERIANGWTVTVKEGAEITLPATVRGCRTYLAVHGGIAVESLLGGSSEFPWPQHDREPRREISAGPRRPFRDRRLPHKTRFALGREVILRCVVGPDAGLLPEAQQTGLFAGEWLAGQRMSRMGIELNGETLTPRSGATMASAAVFPGTIQCPPSGAPFLLGPDAQTTGGYPRIAQVIRADRHLIGQIRPGMRIRLIPIESGRARDVHRHKLMLWRRIVPDLRLD